MVNKNDTEATYRKSGSLGQSKLTENSFLSSSRRSEDLMVDRIEGSGTNPDNVIVDVRSGDSERTIEIDLETLQIEEEKNNKLTEERKNRNHQKGNTAETTKESEDSRETNSEGKEAETQSLIETIQNNTTEDQEMIEA
ncbi:28003_t:CDS:2, partial [Gigaspora margarita]